MGVLSRVRPKMAVTNIILSTEAGLLGLQNVPNPHVTGPGHGGQVCLRQVEEVKFVKDPFCLFPLFS